MTVVGGFQLRGDGWYEFWFHRRDQPMVDLIKAQAPPHGRNWDPNRPDQQGGDNATMAKINAAWDRIKVRQ